MKQLDGVSNGVAELEVWECDCGFHIGIDATFLDQVGPVEIPCPACTLMMKIPEFDDHETTI